jgi:predicted ester cyclase
VVQSGSRKGRGVLCEERLNHGKRRNARADNRSGAQFHGDFPDMVIAFERLESRGDAVAFHWTLIGTNTGPGGTGNKVRISGYELWKIDNDGLIGESKGNFDAADYERQIRGQGRVT